MDNQEPTLMQRLITLICAIAALGFASEAWAIGKTGKGALAGAAAGAVVAGPVGAVVGAGTGAVVGSHWRTHHRRPRHHYHPHG
jgi:hypothetical protein